MSIATAPHASEEQTVEQIKAGRTRIQAELGKVIIGQKDVIEQLLIGLFSRGQPITYVSHQSRASRYFDRVAGLRSLAARHATREGVDRLEDARPPATPRNLWPER